MIGAARRDRFLAVAVVSSFAIAACAAPETAETPSASATPTPSAVAASTSAPTSPAASSQPAVSSPGIATTSIELELVASGFSLPIGITWSPDLGHGAGLLVSEQRGPVRLVHLEGTIDDEPFLDLTGHVSPDAGQPGHGDEGPLGLALHPEVAANGRVFVHYTDPDGTSLISEFTVRNGRVDAATERLLLRIERPRPDHFGGQLAFGPDGYLYMSIGEGGSGSGQDPHRFLGTLLRVDVDAGRAGGAPYAIPADNPFADGVAGAPEVWAYGFRNPWRFSFDRLTGDVWIGDVGESSFEEVDLLRAGSPGGANFGWPIAEGPGCVEAPDCEADRFSGPVAVYDHAHGCSVTGGYVYRGTAQPALTGSYVFADFCTGTVFVLPADEAAAASPASPVVPRIAARTNLVISSFGEDEAGELYLVDYGGGSLYRIVTASAG